MRKLRGGSKPGRAAVVVPNGTLFGDGVAARIKARLLTDFNLHTVVRLPNGVFAPYTNIPTNLLFFDRTGPTQDVWFYEQPLPPGRKNYTKTAPLQFEEFADCLAWWPDRKPTDRAWSVPAAELLATNCNLDRKNPAAKADLDHLPPEQLVASHCREGTPHPGHHGRGEGVAHRRCSVSDNWPRVSLGNLLRESRDAVAVAIDGSYPNFGIYSFGRGLFAKEPISGAATSAATLYRAKGGQFVYSRLFAFEGAYGVVPDALDGYVVSNEFPLFHCDEAQLDVRFLSLYVRRRVIWEELARLASGLGDRRKRLHPSELFKHHMPLPADRRAAADRGARSMPWPPRSPRPAGSEPLPRAW